MATHLFAARFGVLPAKDVVLARLREEIGAESADEVEFDWRYEPKKLRGAAYRGDLPTTTVSFVSIDIIALVYVKKICVALGGVPIDPASGEPQPPETPAWAKSPWLLLNPLERLRIRLRVIRI